MCIVVGSIFCLEFNYLIVYIFVGECQLWCGRLFGVCVVDGKVDFIGGGIIVYGIVIKGISVDYCYRFFIYYSQIDGQIDNIDGLWGGLIFYCYFYGVG